MTKTLCDRLQESESINIRIAEADSELAPCLSSITEGLSSPPTISLPPRTPIDVRALQLGLFASYKDNSILTGAIKSRSQGTQSVEATVEALESPFRGVEYRHRAEELGQLISANFLTRAGRTWSHLGGLLGGTTVGMMSAAVVLAIAYTILPDHAASGDMGPGQQSTPLFSPFTPYALAIGGLAGAATYNSSLRLSRNNYRKWAKEEARYIDTKIKELF